MEEVINTYILTFYWKDDVTGELHEETTQLWRASSEKVRTHILNAMIDYDCGIGDFYITKKQFCLKKISEDKVEAISFISD